MLTGSGVNTKSWPIDRPVQGGVMRKLPGSSEWTFVRGLTDAQMRRLGKTRQDELLRLHGGEPRDVEIVIPDSSALRKLVRFGVMSGCAPPCTLAARLLYRQLPQLASDSMMFWGKGDRKSTTPGTRQRPLPPDAGRTPPPRP